MSQEEWNFEFWRACGNGDIEKVKDLTTRPEHAEVMDIHLYMANGFLEACRNGHLEVVKWLSSSEEMRRAQEEAGCWRGFVNIHAGGGFRLACTYGHVSVVKWLTSSKEMRRAQERAECWSGYIDIHTNNEEGFQLACDRGHLGVVRWLTGSEEMRMAQEEVGAWKGFTDIHAREDLGFIMACIKGNTEVIRELLFELCYTPLEGVLKVWNDEKEAYEKRDWIDWLELNGFGEVLAMVEEREIQKAVKEGMNRIKCDEGGGEKKRGLRL